MLSNTDIANIANESSELIFKYSFTKKKNSNKSIFPLAFSCTFYFY